MTIHTPNVQSRSEHVRVFAPVELDRAPRHLPKKFILWYEFPKAYSEYVTDRADAFVVALLFLAIWLQEDIDVKSPLSPRLEHGLREYQRIFAAWFPRAEPVDIVCDTYEHFDSHNTEDATACFFSGGVDSFFTLWSHLPEQENNPDYQITHGLFIHGFALGLDQKQSFQSAFRAYRRLFNELDLTLIPVRTNLKKFVNNHTCGWRAAHGAFLTSIPLVLGGLLSRCYVPSTHTYQDNVPNGSHPLVDHLLSTESLQIIHDGAWATRVEKTEVIAQWPATYDKLYVCFDRSQKPLENCCRCEKCIRTMTALKLMGALDRYATFPLPLRRKDIRTCPLYYETARGWMQELIDYAESVDRRDIAFDVRYALFRLTLRNSAPGRFLRRLVRRSDVAERLLAPLRRLVR